MATYRPFRDSGSVRGPREYLVFVCLFVCVGVDVEKDGSGFNGISEHGLYLLIFMVVEKKDF